MLRRTNTPEKSCSKRFEQRSKSSERDEMHEKWMRWNPTLHFVPWKSSAQVSQKHEIMLSSIGFYWPLFFILVLVGVQALLREDVFCVLTSKEKQTRCSNVHWVEGDTGLNSRGSVGFVHHCGGWYMRWQGFRDVDVHTTAWIKRNL